MANCSSGNQTLDPHQSILDGISKATTTLENQSRSILPSVSSFRDLGNAFPADQISPSSTVNSALDKMTAEALCAGKTNLDPINQLAEDCLNEALKGVRKYLKDLLGNIESGIDLISEILALPESILMKAFQKIWKLCDNISGLVGSIDGKLQCVSLSEQASEYADQIQSIQDRVNSVTGDLKLSDDGKFDPDKLMEGFDSGLKSNINLYKTKSEAVQKDIKKNISNTVDLSATVVPKRFF
jgi:hypothetical protein